MRRRRTRVASGIAASIALARMHTRSEGARCVGEGMAASARAGHATQRKLSYVVSLGGKPASAMRRVRSRHIDAFEPIPQWQEYIVEEYDRVYSTKYVDHYSLQESPPPPQSPPPPLAPTPLPAEPPSPPSPPARPTPPKATRCEGWCGFESGNYGRDNCNYRECKGCSFCSQQRPPPPPPSPSPPPPQPAPSTPLPVLNIEFYLLQAYMGLAPICEVIAAMA
mmetsp:Transcript_24985/g.58218  ORF Transcript_24985/g.58218 Transcript_24985/m.58218 type:complete len:223 (+) Transcript_24985:627-1295(+)